MTTTALDGQRLASPARPGGVGSRTSVLGRVSGGHALMVVAALLAGLLNYGLLRSADGRVAISTAAGDLPAGHVLSAEDLATSMVAVDEGLLASLLTPERTAAAVGSVTTGPLRTGDPLRAGDLTEPAGDGLRAMSLPIARAHAAGGALEAGDVVDVVTVSEGRARFALAGVEVLTVQRSAGAGLAGAGELALTLAVDDRQALRLAAAMAAGDVQVVRSTGAPAADADVAGAG